MNSAQGGLLSLIENSTSEVIGWGAVEENDWEVLGRLCMENQGHAG